ARLISLNACGVPGRVTSPPMTATRESLGTISFRSSSCFPLISGERVLSPVMFPPGLERLATNPEPTGSWACPERMGIVAVACLAGRVAGGPTVTITSTLTYTSSAASAGRRSAFPSADRHSMTMFFPSTYPRSRRPWRNASVRAERVEGETGIRNPIRGTFLACCASTKEPVDNRAAATRQMINFVFIVSASRLSNHLIRSCQHVRRNRQTDLLGGFEVDDELELRRLLHREISRLGAFQNLVHIRGSASEQVGGVRAIVHESAGFRIVWLWVNRREPVLCRQVRKLCSL